MTTRQEIKMVARRLRKKQTEAERVFWLRVRNRRLDGIKFQRQFSIAFDVSGKKRFFVADFYCYQFRLVVEIDGSVHEDEEQRKHDEFRTERLEEKGIKVVRFANKMVLSDIEKVLDEIRKYFK